MREILYRGKRKDNGECIEYRDIDDEWELAEDNEV